ncbi:MAG: LysR family transcriptional regulator [Chloroflexota bacterium]
MKKIQPSYSYKQNRSQQLRGFYHVATTGSFSAAAKQMCIGQPAVTLQVQSLERELQAKLFNRKKGVVSLTLDGQVLFEVAAPLVQALESLDDVFRERLGQLEAGKATCAIAENLVVDIMPKLMGEFHSRYPNIDLVIYSCNSLQALEMVSRGDAELGIGTINRLPRHMCFQHLGLYDSYLVVSKDHPLACQEQLSLDEIAQYPLIAPVEEGKSWQDLLQAMEGRGFRPKIAMRLSSIEARLRFVEAGLGATVAVGRWFPHSDLIHKLVWISLRNHLPSLSYGLIRRRYAYLSLPAKRLAEFFTDSVPTIMSARRK